MIRPCLLTCCLPLAVWASGEKFLNPPEYVGAPDAAHATDNRAITMVSSLAVTPGGRMWATWYAGITPAEDKNNYVALATSADSGKTWQEVLVVDPDGAGEVRAFDPELWMAPDGNLYLIWAQTIEHDGSVAGVWALKIKNPESAQPQYDPPLRWTNGIMMCKPIVLSTGEWVLPVSTWRKTDDSAKMVVSPDGGKTWTVRGACNVPQKARSFDEHIILERTDGTLWMLARTRYGMGQSLSTDAGRTWPELAPSEIAHTSSRFFITRLRSGHVLLVKHGAIDEKTKRSHLTAFLSYDEGKTWSKGLLLDERLGVSYPDGQQAQDGTIYITYDYNRTTDREILLACFREEDVLSGKADSPTVHLRQRISKGSGGQEKKEKPAHKPAENADERPLFKDHPGSFLAPENTLVAFTPGVRLFGDSGYMLREVPDVLKGASFIEGPLPGEKRWVCKKPGMRYFATPQTGRNADRMEQSLREEGFEKTAIAQLQLFKGEKGLSSLYQKSCAKDEMIAAEKWTIPLFFAAADAR